MSPLAQTRASPYDMRVCVCKVSFEYVLIARTRSILAYFWTCLSPNRWRLFAAFLSGLYSDDDDDPVCRTMFYKLNPECVHRMVYVGREHTRVITLPSHYDRCVCANVHTGKIANTYTHQLCIGDSFRNWKCVYLQGACNPNPLPTDTHTLTHKHGGHLHA